MNRQLIVLDPACGGRQVGLERGGVCEKDIALAICLHLREQLLEAGVDVVMTREADEEVSALRRIETANMEGVSLYVGWRCDALEDETVHGVSLWVDDRSSELKHMIDVELIGNELCAESGQLMMGVFQEPDKIMSLLRVPAVQIRGAFLSNQEERARAADADFQKLQAKGAAKGILDVLHKYVSRSGR